MMKLTSLSQATALLLFVSNAFAQPVPLVASAASGVVRWTCQAFYLPARSIWQRTIAVELDSGDVRAVHIDGVPVYTFHVHGSTILTAMDSERVQFDSATQTWSSDLRGMVTSLGRCDRLF